MVLQRRLMAGLAMLASGLWALAPGDAAPALDGVVYVKGVAPDFAAQWTLVEFWATWCGPCKRTIPHLTELRQQHDGKLVVVGLSDEDEATVRPFVQAQGAVMLRGRLGEGQGEALELEPGPQTVKWQGRVRGKGTGSGW